MFNTKQTKAGMKSIFIGCLASSLMLMSCGSSTEPAAAEGTATEAAAPTTDVHYAVADLVDLDLTDHGIAVITKAPKDAKVMKYEVNGNICVYGGKFFKLTFSKMDGNADDTFNDIKSLVVDKELNPSFSGFEAEDKNSFLKKNTDGQLAFTHALDAGGAAIIIQEGMPYDISPDQFSDYAAEDVKIMYEAAKATKAK